jgi:hypothetical protein
VRRRAGHAALLATLVAGGPAGRGGPDDAAPAAGRAVSSPLQRVEAAEDAGWSTTITAMLREARSAGHAPRVVCRAHGISETTCYRRHATHGVMRLVEVRRLERPVADPALDLAMLKDMAERNP